MENANFEDMYGDLVQEKKDSPLLCNDDSVDIYSGLDNENSPRYNLDSEKANKLFSPSRHKDSLDLYEEILTEERKERDASYNELKMKLECMHLQVKELLSKLQDVQSQNMNLHNENMHLKKNISAVIKTARMEIIRKDEEISRLNQRALRSNNNHFYPRPSVDITKQRNTQERMLTCTRKINSSDQSNEFRPPHPLNLNKPVVFQFSAEATRVPQCDSAFRPNSNESIVRSSPQCDSENSSVKDHKLLTSERSDIQQQSRSKPYVENDKKYYSTGENLNMPCSEREDLRKDDRANEREKAGKDYKDSKKDNEKEGQVKKNHCDRELLSLRRSERSKSPIYSKNLPQSENLKELHGTGELVNSLQSHLRDHEDLGKSSRHYPRHRQHQERSDKRDSKDRKYSKSSSQIFDKSSGSSLSRKSKSSMRGEHRKEERRKDEGRRNKVEREKSPKRRKEEEKSKSNRNEDIHGKSQKSPPTGSRKSGEKKYMHSRIKSPSKQSSQMTDHSRKQDSPDSSNLKSSFKQTTQTTDCSEESNTSSCNIVGDKIQSRNRKLCFMETLNLTLSPVKKSVVPFEEEIKEKDTSVQKAPEYEEEICNMPFSENTFIVLDEAQTSLSSDLELSQEESQRFSIEKNLEKENSMSSLPSSGNKDDLEMLHISRAETLETCSADESSTKKSPSVNVSNTSSVGAQDVIPAKANTERHLNPEHSTSIVAVDEENCRESSCMLNVTVNSVFQIESQSTEGTTSVLKPEDTSILNISSSYLAPEAKMIDERTTSSILPDHKDDSLCSPILNEFAEKSEKLNLETENLLETLKIQADSFLDGGKDSENKLDCGTQNIPPDVNMNQQDNDVSIEAVSSTVSLTEKALVEKSFIDLENHNGNEITSCCNTESHIEVLQSKTDVSEQKDEQIVLNEKSSNSIEKTVENEVAVDVSGDSEDSDSSGADILAVQFSSSESLPEKTEDIQLFDEDSMLITLQTIRQIPDVISPLKSPVRQLRKSPRHGNSGIPSIVKTGCKELSSSPNIITSESKIMELNKENQKPSGEHAERTGEDSSSSSVVEEEIEEGEIVSDTEEEKSPPVVKPNRRKQNLAALVKKVESPKRRVLHKNPSGKVKPPSKGSPQNRKKSSSPNTSGSPSSRRRFRTVLTSLPVFDPSTIHEVMDMLKFIRKQIRKKYMKLHKSFPAKTFYSFIEMSLSEFTEFITNLNCSKLTKLQQNLKSKLCKIVTSTMRKISNNGIVNRIFEQQAPNLKSKLWMFVEDQFNFLFRELELTLTSMCESAKTGTPSEDKIKKYKRNKGNYSCKRKEVQDTFPQKNVPPVIKVAAKPELSTCISTVRTGLGKGKNIRILEETDSEKDPVEANKCFKEKTDQPQVNTSKTTEGSSQDWSSVENQTNITRTFSNNSANEKSDCSFELLTEQQTSSLTFNLVTDSQMGEIFKCLLQGSDFLDQSDNHNWPIGTPRKICAVEEKLVGLLTPGKSFTPFKSSVGLPWTSTTPEKFPVFNSQIGLCLNPAAFDESCMLEIPCNERSGESCLPPEKVASQSVLVEDLAVSLTIPSPLKSDSHLSFLQHKNGEVARAPDSVLSAHYSEDALLEGEDATEQDIHLALDSDNSSSKSDSGTNWPKQDTSPGFHFRSNLPMQAVVMEKSNDHFIVKIRHTSTTPGECEEANQQIDSEACNADLITCKSPTSKDRAADLCDKTSLDVANDSTSKALFPDSSSLCNQELHPPNLNDDLYSTPAQTVSKTEPDSSTIQQVTGSNLVCESYSPGMALSSQNDEGQSKSKKKRNDEGKPEAKRTKGKLRFTSKDERKKRKSEENLTSCSPKRFKLSSHKNKESSLSLSPKSLSAKNVVMKKGAILVAWTREDDRIILTDLKKEGASQKTFMSLGMKLNKSPSQVCERFNQLMKLFKKAKKMKT
ncbi:CASP8-associated protein 2 [Polypterus senegalus]|nr:CASP8-associated protein 2 [Polypterus senegalus]XP_039603917.1 CASP8-associated protein 2 [Polypterus senegalus]